MTPQNLAKKALATHSAGLDAAEKKLMGAYASAVAEMACELMTGDCEQGADKHKALKAMIAACEVCLVGLRGQQKAFADAD